MTDICAFPTCNLPVFIEQRTRTAHRYCGRTHAIEDGSAPQAPHGRCMECNLLGCPKNVVYDATTGRVHNFCSKDYAERAINRGILMPIIYLLHLLCGYLLHLLYRYLLYLNLTLALALALALALTLSTPSPLWISPLLNLSTPSTLTSTLQIFPPSAPSTPSTHHHQLST